MNKLNVFTSTLMILVLLLTAAPGFISGTVFAAPSLENREVLIGSSVASATTTHTFSFDVLSSDSLGSYVFEYCANSPLHVLPCTVPAGLDVSSATLASQSGETGFSIHGSTTANKLVLTRTPSSPTPPVPSVYRFTGVVNPSTPDRSFFVRLSTYGSTDGTGTIIDSGGVAFATDSGIGVSAYVPPFLEFCVAITIPKHNCSQAEGYQASFGRLSANQTKTATSQMTARTNADNGYTISTRGTTLTSGIESIDRVSSLSTSQAGTNQFGFNLRNNSGPNVGKNVFGPGHAGSFGDYNVKNRYKFKHGDIIVSHNEYSDYRTWTHSYIANIARNQPGGIYTTTISYIALASF